MRYTIETTMLPVGWNDEDGFRFRLVYTDNDTQKRSGWAPSDKVAFIGQVAAVTPFYTDLSEIVIVTLEQAMCYIGVGEEV